MKHCLYCGGRISAKQNFHGDCYQRCQTYFERKRSTCWNLLDVLADRGGLGIPDAIPMLDEWERLGLVVRTNNSSKYRVLSERGKQLYEYIRVRRLKRHPEKLESTT